MNALHESRVCVGRGSLLTICGAIALLTALLSSTAAAAVPRKEHPNLVFVLADQWRAKATGYSGDPNVKTPNLDRLAAESLNFRNAVSVCPVCTPYRAALMTGRFPTSTGMFLNDLYLPDDEVCLAEVLRASGYNTGYIGKWHLDGHGRMAFIPPERRQGWDYWKAAECDHNYLHSHYYEGDSPTQQFWQGYDVFAQTRDAQAYIREHAGKAKPFALMLSYGAPHFPHKQAPQEFQAMYPPGQIKLAPNVPENEADAARSEAQGYYGHCTAIDKAIGELLVTIKEAGIVEDTIVVFTSDHGEALGSHGVRPTQKQVAFDESSHVPLLLRYPAAQRAAGRTLATPLTTPDLTVTLLALMGIKVPAAMEGRDLSGVVRTGAEQNVAALYMNPDPFGGDNRGEYRAIRTSRYTYVRYLREKAILLFDDVNDPHQMKNLAELPQHAALCAEMEQCLQAELKCIGDTFQPAKYYPDRWGLSLKPYQSPNFLPEAGREIYSPKLKTDVK